MKLLTGWLACLLAFISIFEIILKWHVFPRRMFNLLFMQMTYPCCRWLTRSMSNKQTNEMREKKKGMLCTLIPLNEIHFRDNNQNEHRLKCLISQTNSKFKQNRENLKFTYD